MTPVRSPQAHAVLVPGSPDVEAVQAELKLEPVDNPLTQATLCAVGGAVRVSGPAEFPLTVLIQPYDPAVGIDILSIRLFRWNESTDAPERVWSSGSNVTAGFAWARITNPGIYAAVGLPADPLLRTCLFQMASDRKEDGHESRSAARRITLAALEPFLSLSAEELEELRAELTRRAQAGQPDVAKRRGRGGRIAPPPLPGGVSPAELRERIGKLEPPATGLAEEALFEVLADTAGRQSKAIFEDLPKPGPTRFKLPCWLISDDWPMYHHDASHSGTASGCSNISSTNASSLTKLAPIGLDGKVITIPSIVGGKVYVGTVNNSVSSGTLYKIDLATGAIDGPPYVVPDTTMSNQGYTGIGGSPAIVGDRAYFTSFGGMVYCVDTTTMTLVWSTDLNSPSMAANQPISNLSADTWSSPLVVNGRVYVGTGEGESGAYGFIWCLDAAWGHVQWLFCTNQFTGGNDGGQTNLPNVIPKSCLPGGLLPAWASSFNVGNNPPYAGCSPWSSLAYDPTHNKVILGLGNSTAGGGLPDAWYGSGALALDATTGTFEGYNAPQGYDSYYTGDSDADMPSSPTVFTRAGKRVLGIGSKNGSFLVYEVQTMGQLNSRQLLPKDAVTGAHLPLVDPGGAGGGENYYGIFGTAAVHFGLGRLYVGLGGYSGGIDSTTTPFVRALNWSDLSDAWPTHVVAVGTNQVSMYNVGPTPLYANAGEAGLGSPAVVNDVVFVSTSLPALYAFDAHTGTHLWTAPNIPAPTPDTYILGPAVSGSYVVVGCGNQLYRYQMM